MLRKIRLQLAVGQPVYISSPLMRTGEICPSVCLDSVVIENNSASWVLSNDQNSLVEGRLGTNSDISRLISSSGDCTGSWAALALPIAVNLKSNRLKYDFIFCVPGRITINNQRIKQ